MGWELWGPEERIVVDGVELPGTALRVWCSGSSESEDLSTHCLGEDRVRGDADLYLHLASAARVHVGV
jgi:hypothetical protein